MNLKYDIIGDIYSFLFSESARKIRSTLKSSIFIPVRKLFIFLLYPFSNLKTFFHIQKLPQKSLKFPWISIAKPAKSLPFPAKPNHNPPTLVKTTQTIENTKISGTLQRVKRKLQCNRIKTEITNKSKPRIIEAYRKQLRKVNVNGIKTKMKPTKKCIEKSQDVRESINEDEIEDTLRNMGLEVSITEGMEVISISEEKAKQVDDKTNDTDVIDLDSSADPLDISTVDLCCEDADEEMPHENSNIDNNSQNSSSEIIDMVSSEDQATTEQRAMASSQKRANKLHTNLNDSQEDTHQMEVIGMEGTEDQSNNVTKQDINYIKDKSVCLGEAIVSDSLKIQTIVPKEELHQPSALKVPPFSNYQTISPIQTDISQNIYSYNESLNEVREFQDLLKPYNDGSFASCIDEGILRDLRGIQDSVNDFAIFLHRTYMDIEDFELEQR